MDSLLVYMEVAQLDLFLNVKEILVISAYSAVVNLFESLILLSVLLALTILLPKQWFSDRAKIFPYLMK